MRTNTEFLQKYFWEYNLYELDLVKHAEFIINRVLSRCDFQDLKKLIEIFSIEKITQIVKDSIELALPRKNIIISYISLS